MKSILQSSSVDTEFSKIKNLEIQRISFIIFKYLKKKKDFKLHWTKFQSLWNF